MAYWGGGGAAGWSGGDGGPVRRGRSDGWDYQELGKVYDARLMARLWPFIKPYRWRGITAIVAMIVVSVAQYSQPYIIGRGLGSILDRLIERGELPAAEQAAATAAIRSDLMQVSLALVALAVIGFVAMAVQRLMTGHIGHSLLLNLRKLMFRHLNRLSMRFYDNEEVGRVMSRVTSDVVTLQELMTSGALNVLSDILGLALIIGFLFALDVQLALVAMAVIPVLVIFMVLWQGYAAQAFIKTRIAIAIVNSNLNENVSGVRVVQSMGREEENLRHFGRLNDENLRANLDAAKLQALVMPMVEILSTVASALVLIVIGIRTFNGDLGASEAVEFATAFLLYIQRFFNPVRDITLQYTQLQRAMAGAHRIFEVLDTVPEIQDAPDAIALDRVEGRVDFNHVKFEYVPGVPVLKDFDLHVEPGETIALVGHTGAGKTSVTALVPRFYDIKAGGLLIDGHDIRKIRLADLTRNISIVLQEPYLFSGTIAENIRYGRLDATDEDVVAAATAVGANEFIDRLPDGYETVLHERGQNLSVGQRQLISFARALIADPRILILDEATANVDTQTEKLIQRALDTMLRDRTSFVIAHRLSTIRNATRIVVMREGEIVEIGSHDELMARDGVYADLYKMTFTGLSHDEAVAERTEG
ncbi:MAG: ABC transporter ATP-binding protein/permease [Dehalococcoidia bacterium]|nr:ABC transporter ATP-binding protein/permease [Dehalococcoidia bacterium]